MADYDMNALLKSYGAPMSARNANAAREFFANNPEVATHRAMGMRGSVLDDNSDLLNSLLEHADPTLANPQQQQQAPVPQGRVDVGQPVKAPQQGAPVARRPDMSGAVPPYAVGTTASRQGNYSPNGQPQQGQPGGPGFDLGEWLMSLLGVSSAGALAGGRGGGTNVPPAAGGREVQPFQGPEASFVGRMERAGRADPRASGYFEKNRGQLEDHGGLTQEDIDAKSREYEEGRGSRSAVTEQRKIENQGPTKVTNSPELNAEGENRANKYAKDYQDVQDENSAHAALEEQQARRLRDQLNAKETVSKAKRAVGRK